MCLCCSELVSLVQVFFFMWWDNARVSKNIFNLKIITYVLPTRKFLEKRLFLIFFYQFMFLKYWERPLVVHPRQYFFWNDAKIKFIFFMGVDFRKKATGILIKFFIGSTYSLRTCPQKKKELIFRRNFWRKHLLQASELFFGNSVTNKIGLHYIYVHYKLHMYFIYTIPSNKFLPKNPNKWNSPKKGWLKTHTVLKSRVGWA